jgi:hypothetical protein
MCCPYHDYPDVNYLYHGRPVLYDHRSFDHHNHGRTLCRAVSLVVVYYLMGIGG